MSTCQHQHGCGNYLLFGSNYNGLDEQGSAGDPLYNSVLTTLENSGIFLTLENSGKTQGNLKYARESFENQMVCFGDTIENPCVIILSNSSIDWLCDTLTDVCGAGHHAPQQYIL